MKLLNGIKVVDVSRLLPGGFCSMILAELGADVIKVEEPGIGDYMRLAPPLVDDVSFFHSTVNKNKRSIAVDLKKNEGKKILEKLIINADIFIEGFRPGVMKKLGFDFETVSKLNRRIIYCSISSFGQLHNMSRIPGHDLNFQAMSGVFTTSKVPKFPTVQYADMVAGLYAAIGTLAALSSSRRRAIHIDVPIVQSLTSLQILHLASYLSNVSTDFDGLLYGEEPYYKFYRTKDQKHIAIAAIEEKFRLNLLRILKAEDIMQLMNGSKEDRQKAERRLAAIIKMKTRDEWTSILMEKETCITPVLDISEVLKYPWSREVYDAQRKVLIIPIKSRGEKKHAIKEAPSIGEDTDDILSSLGYSKREIMILKSKNVVQ
jgi:crotonobetainyl-CoA:carnitine CoA-transferase CaiB-like acyl-CoA transferase